MKAAVMLKTNTPWEIQTLPDPQPKAGQVLVKVHASGCVERTYTFIKGSFPFLDFLCFRA